MLPEHLAVTFLVVEAFEQLNIPYLIGGSLASALHGTARSTLDTDFVADLQLEQVMPLVELLRGDFYIDDAMILDAIIHRSSFNMIHLATAFKIDVFLPKNREFDQVQLQRRQLETISSESERKVFIATAEDIILAKLEWYRLGGEVSDRQWRDILGILKLQGERLDWDYLQKWAIELSVNTLLRKALDEGIGSSTL